LASARILLLNFPPLVRGIAEEAISTRPEFELVGTLPGKPDPLPAARRLDANVVISFLEEATGVTDESSLSVISISDSGRIALGYTIRPHKISIDLTPDSLLNAIEKCVGATRERGGNGSIS
jgi:hypothetical protein